MFESSVSRRADELAAVQDPDLFLLMPSAGFYYLVSDRRNPTPFDYPVTNFFGPEGEAGMVRRLQSGEVPSVCWWHRDWPLQPSLVEEDVEDKMSPVARIGPCTLYRWRQEEPGTGAGTR